MRSATPLLSLLMLGGCAPDETELAEVSELRVLGVVADPPEAAPGAPIQLSLVAASPSGPVIDGSVRWSVCSLPKALSEPGFASAACIDGADPALPARSLSVSLSIPPEACARFGGADDADLRPRDADDTGGYYQPVRAALAGAANPTLVRLRMLCPLRDAPIDLVKAYAERYRPNQNPAFDEVAAPEETGDRIVAPGAEISLAVRVSANAFERFVTYEHSSNQLVERTESLTVSWFVSAGELVENQVLVPEHGAVVTHFRAPKKGGVVHVWVMLRDDRGGLNYRMQRLQIGG